MKTKQILSLMGIALLISACGESENASSNASIKCGHKITDNDFVRQNYGGKVISNITVTLPASLIEKSVDLEMSDESQPGVAKVSAVMKTINGQEVNRSGNVVYTFKNGKVNFVDSSIQEAVGFYTVDPDEFETDFGRYPDITCELM